MKFFLKIAKSALQDLKMIYGLGKPKAADKADFIFIVHPRHREDVEKYFPFLKLLPDAFMKLVLKLMWPVRAHKIESRYNGKVYHGWTVGVLLLPRQMLDNRKLARKKILKALKLGGALEAKIAGLGALTPSITLGGAGVANKSPISITNGYAMTVSAVSQTTFSLIEKGGLNVEKINIAIVGAAGSVGSNVARVLSKANFREIILIDVERKKHFLDKLKTKLGSNHERVVVESNVEAVKKAHIIVTATNAKEVVLKSELLSPGTLIIDDAQPSDVEKDVVKNRDDVVVTEAGIIYDPNTSVRPNLELASEHDLFSCLAEVILLTINHKTDDHFSIGKLNPDMIEKIQGMMENSNFTTGEYQNYTGVIPNEKLQNVFNLLKQRYGSD